MNTNTDMDDALFNFPLLCKRDQDQILQLMRDILADNKRVKTQRHEQLTHDDDEDIDTWVNLPRGPDGEVLWDADWTSIQEDRVDTCACIKVEEAQAHIEAKV